MALIARHCALLFLCLVAAEAYDYQKVLSKSLLFYEAQRSGKLPDDNRIPWRGDSALDDQGDKGEDLTGGYYDAGDYLKLGFPMASTTTLLAWGLISNKDGYTAASQVNHCRQAVKWATDYFIKCHVSVTTFYGQVGKMELDHDYWGRPEDMDMKRPAYKINKNNPGSDLAGETAAALAAASIAFKSWDPDHSQDCLDHAKELFDFADNYRGLYHESITDALDSYPSTAYEDELVWAATWLYKATKDDSYLQRAEDLYDEFGLGDTASEFSWDDKYAGVQVLLAQLTGKSKYKNAAKDFCDFMMNEQDRTPKGLVFIDDWGSLRHAANVAFVCLEAAEAGINPDDYRTFAQEQIDYMLGDGGRSFVVGFGTNYPKRPHHASSSCPDPPDTCDWDNFDSSDPNPHILNGALVGGPDIDDNYQDQRDDYVSNEVTCDYNAGFQSALAGIIKLQKKGLLL